MNPYPRLLQVIVCFFLATLFFSCEKKQPDLWNQQHELLNEKDKLYRAYLAADVLHARQILEQTVKLLENEKVLERVGLARDLFQEYSRLYVLDKRVGNEDSAEVELIKARYWLVCVSEFSGLPSNKVMENVRPANASDILAMVDKQDKLATGGIGPKYLKEIAKGSAKVLEK